MARPSEEEIAKRFGANVFAARRRAKIPRRVVVERSGVSLSGILKIERGNRTPRINTVVALAAALDVKVVDLFAGL